jgi:hypothetical protein
MPSDFSADSLACDLRALWSRLHEQRSTSRHLAVRQVGVGFATVDQRDGVHVWFRLSNGFAYQLSRDKRWRTTSCRVIDGIEFPMSRNSSFCCLDLSEMVVVTKVSISLIVDSGME